MRESDSMVSILPITLEELKKEEAKEVRILIDTFNCRFDCPSEVGLRERHALCTLHGGEKECVECWCASLNKTLKGGNLEAYKSILGNLKSGKVNQLLIDKEGQKIKVQIVVKKKRLSANFYTFEVEDIAQEILKFINKKAN